MNFLIGLKDLMSFFFYHLIKFWMKIFFSSTQNWQALFWIRTHCEYTFYKNNYFQSFRLKKKKKKKKKKKSSYPKMAYFIEYFDLQMKWWIMVCLFWVYFS